MTQRTKTDIVLVVFGKVDDEMQKAVNRHLARKYRGRYLNSRTLECRVVSDKWIMFLEDVTRIFKRDSARIYRLEESFEGGSFAIGGEMTESRAEIMVF